MRKATIYKITVLNWEKHNPNRKKSYKYTMIANNFFNDAKIECLHRSVVCLYLGLLLTCGDLNEHSISTSEATLKRLLRTGVALEEALNQLQSLQLLTWEYLEKPLILNEIKEMKRREENIIKTPEPKKLVAVESKKNMVEFKITPLKIISVKQDLIGSWSSTYPKEYLELEMKKARSWLIANEHKWPKSNWGRFFNSWFDRGWENYRKTLKSEKLKVTAVEIEEMLRSAE